MAAVWCSWKNFATEAVKGGYDHTMKGLTVKLSICISMCTAELYKKLSIRMTPSEMYLRNIIVTVTGRGIYGKEQIMIIIKKELRYIEPLIMCQEL